MPPPTQRVDDDADADADGRGQMDRDASSSSRSTTSQMGDRSSSLPSVRGASPGVSPPTSVFKTPPTSRTGAANAGPPSSLATTRVSPVPPSTRQPAVPIRPPAFRPVPTQTSGTTGPPSRSQVVRAAAAAVRLAAPGQRATGSQPMRPVVSTTRDQTILASPAVPLATKTFKTPPNVRPAAPTSTQSASYAQAATASAPYACPPPKNATNAPLHVSTPASANIQSGQRKTGSDFRRAAAPPPRHRLVGDYSAAGPELKSVAKTLFTSPPPPPRGSAQDSPAMMSACSSRQGSDMSAYSGDSHGDRRDMSPDMPDRVANRGEYLTVSPTKDTLGFDFEFSLDVAPRPQRRPRSPDDNVEEEAKRYCTLPQRNPDNRDESFSPNQCATSPRRNSAPTLNTSADTPNITAAPLVTDKNRPNASAAQPGTCTTGKKVEYTQEKMGVQQTKNADTAMKKPKSPRYPPLIVEKLPNWAAHFRAVRDKLGHPPNARPYQGGIRFLPESADEYRVVQRYLTDLERDSGLSWFAYSLPAERSVKLAIRGLPADTEVEEIEEELRLHGLEPEYVRHIKARGERPGCIFHAVIKRTPDFRKVYDITTFLYMRGVKIEAWRGKEGPAQCHRCQKFRHSSHLCHRPLACVRCGENHAARDCPRPKTEPATCANCAGDHPASNRRCPVFLREAKNKRAGTVASTKQQRNQPTATERPTNAEEKETPSESLMAAANGPTNRQEAPSGRRRKNRRGGKKGKQTQPPTENVPVQDGTTITATHKAQAAAQTAPVAAESEAQEPRTQRRARHDAEANKAQATAPNSKPMMDKNVAPSQQRQTRTTDEQQQQRKPAPKPRREFTACAIKLLMDLIKAIRQGQDVELVILDGLAELLAMYHG